jgi:hypothetical protein
MSAAFDYEDMHHLVDLLNPTQVRRLRLLVTQDEELSQVAEALSQPEPSGAQGAPDGLLALIGSIDGPPDLGERHAADRELSSEARRNVIGIGEHNRSCACRRCRPAGTPASVGQVSFAGT